jgi:hypothetical protein
MLASLVGLALVLSPSTLGSAGEPLSFFALSSVVLLLLLLEEEEVVTSPPLVTKGLVSFLGGGPFLINSAISSWRASCAITAAVREICFHTYDVI